MKTTEKPIETYAGYVGLDWSSKEHVFCIYDAGTAKRTKKTLPNEPAALLLFLVELRGQFANKPVLLGWKPPALPSFPSCCSMISYASFSSTPKPPTTFVKCSGSAASKATTWTPTISAN